MSVTHPDSIRTLICDYIVGLLDAGSTNTYPRLRLLTTATEVAEIDFTGATAFGAAATGVATCISFAENSVTGNASAVDNATLIDQDNTVIIQCSVGATSSGEDIELSNTTISSGDTVTITAGTFTYTAPL